MSVDEKSASPEINITRQMMSSIENLWIQNAVNTITIEYLLNKLEKHDDVSRMELDIYIENEMEKIKSAVALQCFTGASN